ncbi:MAG: Vgb family protein [bacterium]
MLNKALTVLLIAVMPFATSLASEAVLGYAINSDADVNADKLYQITLTTGESHEIGPIGLRYEDTEGLAFDANGELFAADDATDSLITINTANGLTESINTPFNNLMLNNDRGDYGLTFTCSGTLWLASDQEKKLFQVDPNTGETTEVASTGEVGITALASWAGKLYGVSVDTQESLYSIDTETGEITSIGKLNTPTFEDAGMAFDAQGQLWLITDGTHINTFEFGPSLIYRVDTETGAAEFVAETVGGVESLAITSPGGCINGPGTVFEIPTMGSWGYLIMALAMLLSGILFQLSSKPSKNSQI